ncbi:MAG: hypothetical protein J3Q66DRAFT_322106 [Benniella sp.]|nr:MAG: hypothetical protein J3Q66DRAFT_322106 [Benniella sp.]
MTQFPTGYSPANSPLSPGNNYAGDDYFSSRQISPGPASSPSGASSKIKSRPRTSTSGVRVSQGGIKALFGQSGSKGTRASVDLKSDTSINLGQQQPPQALTPLTSQTTPTTNTNTNTNNNNNAFVPPKTPPPKRKKSLKTISAEIPMPIPSITSTTVEQDPQDPSNQESADKNGTPSLTLAERRATTQRQRSASESSTQAQKTASVPSTPTSLIPPNLGLDSRAKRFVLSPNVTPGSENMPLLSPSILSTSGTSPAPIQIDRITPRHSISQARTEEQQRQLDAAMERVNFDDVTVAELKEMLRQRGKHGGGKKADLIKRLQSEIEIIRAHRDASTRGPGVGMTLGMGIGTSMGNASIPPPLASPTHQLNKTLGGMYIDTPPMHAGGATLPLSSSGPSNLRYLYGGALQPMMGLNPVHTPTGEVVDTTGVGIGVGAGHLNGLP